VKAIVKSLHREVRMSYSQDKEGLLYVQKTGMATKPKLRMHQNQFSFLIPRKKKEGNGERKVAGKGEIVL
jgi:hypothetical protein